MANRFIIRQGDVMVREVSPAVHTKLQENWESGSVEIVERDDDRVVLAYGEVTGHAHAFHSSKVTMFRHDGFAGTYIKVDETAELVHEEHDTITVPPGVYEVVRQREYDDSAEIAARQRYVAD